MHDPKLALDKPYIILDKKMPFTFSSRLFFYPFSFIHLFEFLVSDKTSSNMKNDSPKTCGATRSDRPPGKKRKKTGPTSQAEDPEVFYSSLLFDQGEVSH